MGEIETKLVPQHSWRVGVLSPGTFEVSRSKELICEVWFLSRAPSEDDIYLARVLHWSDTARSRVEHKGAASNPLAAVRRAVRALEDAEGLVAWYTAPTGMPSPARIYERLMSLGPGLEDLTASVAALKDVG